MLINGEHLEEAVEIAVEEHAEDRDFTSWQKAVARGAELLLQNRCLPIGPNTLLILSESGGCYVTDGVECMNGAGLCPAYSNHRPCKHRAAHRLVQLLKAEAHASVRREA